MVINANASAVEAATNLQRSNQALNLAIQRLSTGSKINQPSDDPAGLSVSEKMLAQDTRIQAALTNAQHAVSLTQTADGFLKGIGDILTRMSELALMRNDPTKGPGDIALYQIEFDNLRDQMREIVGNGDNGADSDPNWNISGDEPSGVFNGVSLFGARAAMTIVVGPSGDQTLAISGVNLREVGGAMSDLLWDNAVDPSQPTLDLASSGTLDTINAAITQIGEKRAEMGSVQARLSAVELQLRVQGENLEAANSRIRDVDVAEESTKLAKYNILTQAGTSMLSQANTQAANVLALLS